MSRITIVLGALILGSIASANPISCSGGTTPDGGCAPVDENFSLLITGAAATPVTIDWSNASVVITNVNSTTATVTGTTTGSLAIPFVATITTVNGTQDVSRSQLGNVSNALNMNLPATRTSSTLMTVNIRLTGYSMVAPSFALLDVDTSEASSPYSGWQDKITLLGANAGTTLTPTNTSYATVSGFVATGINGNVANNSANGYVAVVEAGTLTSIRMSFGPGANDQFGQNQRFGLSNITITDLVLTPEPGTGGAMAAGLAMLIGFALQRRSKP